jgi:hypothetical protein
MTNDPAENSVVKDSLTTRDNGQPGSLGLATGSAKAKAWMEVPPLLRGCTDYADFSEGWKAAFRAMRDRLPAPDYLTDPLTPREVQKLVEFVEAQLLPNKRI